MRTFEFIDSKSKKFWNIELTDASFTVMMTDRQHANDDTEYLYQGDYE